MILSLLIGLSFAAPSGITSLPSGLIPKETGALSDKRFSLKSAASINLGSSSNVGQKEATAQGDTFFEVSPTIVGQFRTSWRFQAQAFGQGNLRRYTSQEVGDETTGWGGAGLRWWITKNFEIGAKGDIGFFQELEKTYFSRNSLPLNQEYSQQRGHAYVAWHPGRLTLQAGGQAILKDYFTETTDLLGRNFEDDSEDYESWFRMAARFTPKFSLEAVSAVGRTTYLDRMADYSSGYPIEAGFRHPFAATLYHHHSLSSRFKIGSWVFYTGAKARLDKDQAFGARDKNIYSVSQAIEIPVGRKFKLIPQASAHQARYANFVDDPLDAKTALDRDRRKDTWGEGGASLKWQMSPRLEAQTQYTYAMGISNFTAAEFTEHRALVGLNMVY